MAKFNFKQAAINHTEKVVFGIVMLLALLGLASTDWSAYTGTPHDILVKVDQCKSNIQQAIWPAEEEEKYKLTEGKRPANAVKNELFASINPGLYEASVPMFADGLAPKKPITEIVKNVPEQPIATAARVLIEVLPPIDETETDSTLAMAAETTEDDDPNIPDEFRKPKPGAAGGPGGSGYAGYEEMEYAAPDLYDPYATMATPGMTDSYSGGAGYPGSEGYGGMEGAGMTVQKKDAKGYPFVSVRAIFKVRDQISKFAEAMNVSYNQAAPFFYIIDFELQRQAMQPGPDPWAGEWETVDIKVAEDILDESVGFDAETVSSTITDPVITMPLPMRVSGAWKVQATHPAIAKFELTPEQIELEMELNSLMIQEALKQKKAVKETSIKRGGFSDKAFSAGEAQAGMMGMDSMYTSGYEMMGSSPGAMGSIGSMPTGGSPVRPGRGRPAATQQAPQRLDQLLDQLVEKDDKERREKLSEWIQTRAKAEGELLLFRYLDFAVTPGKTYRYRVRFIIPNPNFDRRIADAGGIAAVVQGQTRETDWSEITAPVMVPADVEYFLTSVKAPTFNTYNRLFPTTTWDVFQYDHAFGTTMNSTLELRHGQEIGDVVTTQVIKPAESSYEREAYVFKSEDFLVDVLGDLPVDPAFHSSDPETAIKPIKGARGYMLAQGESLIMTADGPIVYDGASRSKQHEAAKAHLKMQSEYYEDIKKRKEMMAQGTEAGGEYDPYGTMGNMGTEEMMMMMGGGSGSRQKNVLRKSSKSKSRRGGMSSSSGP